MSYPLVRDQGYLKTAACRNAVDRCDDRFVRQQDLFVDIASGTEPGFDIGHIHIPRFVQINAGAKGSVTGSGQNDSLDGSVLVQINQRSCDAFSQLDRNRIQVIRSIKTQYCDFELVFDLHDI